eukprot:c8678_g1_i2.p2 GENE.c8678_g1_i2~~c8678_g1_i2.p2  ORF type:complete len:101 (-),score=12.79 c8678_g1_i2:95-397(-)
MLTYAPLWRSSRITAMLLGLRVAQCNALCRKFWNKNGHRARMHYMKFRNISTGEKNSHSAHLHQHPTAATTDKCWRVQIQQQGTMEYSQIDPENQLGNPR